MEQQSHNAHSSIPGNSVIDFLPIRALARPAARCQHKKATQYHEQGMYDAAIAEYDSVLKVDPGNARAKVGRARAVMAKEAEANFQK